MNAEFKPGELVQLRSGGPVMTVIEWSEGGWPGRGWRCTWFCQAAIRQDTFEPVVLVPYDPENPLPSGLGRPKGKARPK